METPFGAPSDVLRHGIARRGSRRVSFAARARASHRALGDQLPREHLRLQDAGLRRHPLGLRGRKPPGGARAAARRDRRPVPGPHAPPRRFLLRRRPRRPCDVRRSGLPVARRRPSKRARGRAASGSRRGGVYVCMEGPRLLDPRRVAALPLLGRRRHRDDEPDGGEARARGRDLLRVARARDRLRRLARDRRAGVASRRSSPCCATTRRPPAQALRDAVRRLDPARTCGCRDAMRFSILTDRAAIADPARRRLQPILGRYL